jgi:hypothetical protein
MTRELDNSVTFVGFHWNKSALLHFAPATINLVHCQGYGLIEQALGGI